MKISYKQVNVIPKEISQKFGFCIFGTLSQDVIDWISYYGLTTEVGEKYTNIFLLETEDFNFYDLFYDLEFEPFKYIDGFSPNVNKKLHIGHLSNLVLAKAFISMGIANSTVGILGDTLNTEQTISKEVALQELFKLLIDFKYSYDHLFFASSMEMLSTGQVLNLVDGEDQYIGTKVFEIDTNQKVVGIKSDGSTSYFFQDVVFANILNDKTLYLTGHEQKSHFDKLGILFPNIKNIGLGLVTVKGGKMASRLGNVILVEELINNIIDISKFNNDIQLVYNIFAGFILKSQPEKDKSLQIENISNVKNSLGLYISYTMARLNSAGLDFIVERNNKFYSKELEFSYLISKKELNSSKLFNSLVEHCKHINNLYNQFKIKDNEENQQMFKPLLNDLLLASNYLGLFWIKKV